MNRKNAAATIIETTTDSQQFRLIEDEDYQKEPIDSNQAASVLVVQTNKLSQSMNESKHELKGKDRFREQLKLNLPKIQMPLPEISDSNVKFTTMR